jgi:UDP-glucose 4-epimerase
MVVPRFVHSAIKNEPITVFGDGTQQRCFGHVLDVVEGLSKLLESPQCFGQVINLGNDEEVSILCLAEKAIELTGSKSEIRYIPYEEAYGDGFEDMRRRVPGVEKAKKLIGYQPTRSLTDIINDVAAEAAPEATPEAETRASASVSEPECRPCRITRFVPMSIFRVLRG